MLTQRLDTIAGRKMHPLEYVKVRNTIMLHRCNRWKHNKYRNPHICVYIYKI